MARIIDAPLTGAEGGCDPRALTGAWGSLNAAAARGLGYTPEVKPKTDALYEKVKHVVTRDRMARLCAADRGDQRHEARQERGHPGAQLHDAARSSAASATSAATASRLAREAAQTDAAIIVQAGVHFMAETSKILSPDKTVLIPDLRAGCSLAASITGADVRLIKQNFPGVPVVTYVNTTAEVKAESDVCCTSSNAVQRGRMGGARMEHRSRHPAPRRISRQQRRRARPTSRSSPGTAAARCTNASRAEDVAELRAAYPGVIVLAHPECPPDVMEAADFAGSTAALPDYVEEKHPAKVVLLTECSMSDNVAAAAPDVEFIRPCNLCPHMKRITLESIYDALKDMKHEVLIAEDVRLRAKHAIDRMLALPKEKPRAFETGRQPVAVELV